ncbi:MAG: hypothetical protein F6K14_03305 [Symploca sp. SIO2C1]|nr:hypothetical protein [Symploca sp. SIO2C1]
MGSSEETRQEAEPTPNPSQEGNRRQEGREFGLFLTFVGGGVAARGAALKKQGSRNEKFFTTCTW